MFFPFSRIFPEVGFWILQSRRCLLYTSGSECTSHYIRKNVLLDLVLEDMRRVLRYVKEHEQAVSYTHLDVYKRQVFIDVGCQNKLILAA